MGCYVKQNPQRLISIPDWPLKDSRQPWVGQRIRQDFSLELGESATAPSVDSAIAGLEAAEEPIRVYDSAGSVIET